MGTNHSSVSRLLCRYSENGGYNIRPVSICHRLMFILQSTTHVRPYTIRKTGKLELEPKCLLLHHCWRFARERVNWNVIDWNNILFTNESSFALFRSGRPSRLKTQSWAIIQCKVWTYDQWGILAVTPLWYGGAHRVNRVS